MMNNAATVRYMSGGLINVPIVIRGPANGGTNVGATHSHTPENIFANMPGLKVVSPATARDAKGLLKTAIRDNDPVYFMENTLLYGEKSEVSGERRNWRTAKLLIPLGVAAVAREGSDISLIAHGRAVITSLKAAEMLEAEHGIQAEVIDIRSVRPLDEATILESVRKTNRAIYIEENKPFCGVGAQIASTIQETGLRRSRCAGPSNHQPGRPRHLQPAARRETTAVSRTHRRTGAHPLLRFIPFPSFFSAAPPPPSHGHLH